MWGEGGDVTELRDLWPVLTQQADTERVHLGECDGAQAAGLRSECKPTNAGE
jgi:hypothetical protein